MWPGRTVRRGRAQSLCWSQRTEARARRKNTTMWQERTDQLSLGGAGGWGVVYKVKMHEFIEKRSCLIVFRSRAWLESSASCSSFRRFPTFTLAFTNAVSSKPGFLSFPWNPLMAERLSSETLEVEPETPPQRRDFFEVLYLFILFKSSLNWYIVQ